METFDYLIYSKFIITAFILNRKKNKHYKYFVSILINLMCTCWTKIYILFIWFVYHFI